MLIETPPLVDPEGFLLRWAMDFEAELDKRDPRGRLEVWKSLAPFLSAGELKTVMARASRGEDLTAIHRDMGLMKKYQVEMIRILGRTGP